MKYVPLVVGAVLLVGCGGTAPSGTAPTGTATTSVATSGALSSSAATTTAAPAGSESSMSTPPGTSSSAGESISDTVLPTLTAPTTPPKTPSDNVTGLWEVGIVTRGGSGPCYGLRTDDGRVIDLWSAAGETLAMDATIRVRIVASEEIRDCGDGTPFTILEVDTAG